MGKRKSTAKPPPKKRMDKLDTVFSCPFCNHGTSVECRIDMKNLIGEASCGICQESFSTTVDALTEPIDIYSEWIDECERVNALEDEDVERFCNSTFDYLITGHSISDGSISYL
ncbi:transcription elongation factor-like protein [Perilla frutescens var. frutescens]|nr:transcription elongation factor-like protein [Perilla frutescens var. frutescens]